MNEIQPSSARTISSNRIHRKLLPEARGISLRIPTYERPRHLGHLSRILCFARLLDVGAPRRTVGTDAHRRRMYDGRRILDVGAGAKTVGRVILRAGQSHRSGDARTLFANPKSHLRFRKRHDRRNASFFPETRRPSDISGDRSHANYSRQKRISGLGSSLWRSVSRIQTANLVLSSSPNLQLLPPGKEPAKRIRQGCTRSELVLDSTPPAPTPWGSLAMCVLIKDLQRSGVNVFANKGLSSDMASKKSTPPARDSRRAGHYFPAHYVFTRQPRLKASCFQSFNFGARRALRINDGEDAPRIPLGD